MDLGGGLELGLAILGNKQQIGISSPRLRNIQSAACEGVEDSCVEEGGAGQLECQFGLVGFFTAHRDESALIISEFLVCVE
jgi:hypothetical protein